MKNKLKQYLIIFIMCLFAVNYFSACGKSGQTESASENDGRLVESYIPNEDMLGKPYLIISLDMTSQQMMLMNMSNKRQLLCYYNLNTIFHDKYGGLNSITSFQPGVICTIDDVDEKGLISELSISSEVWEYENIENYDIDIDRGVFKIGVTNYSIKPDTPVFSNGVQLDLSGIGENDILRLIGQGKEIWSIMVTTGHGIISLINTSAFDGSLICIGNIYTLINGDMSIEVPEGKYDINVANNGYGGYATLEVTRGGQITLDLETIKSQEAQYCQLTFNIEVADAEIKIDGNPVNKDETFPILYGRHVLSVNAPGYESWSKYLFVNSPTATIMLTMEEEGKSNSTSNNNSNNNNTSSDSAEKDSDKKEEESDQEKKDNLELEYLTTIRDTVSSIMNSISM